MYLVVLCASQPVQSQPAAKGEVCYPVKFTALARSGTKVGDEVWGVLKSQRCADLCCMNHVWKCLAIHCNTDCGGRA